MSDAFQCPHCGQRYAFQSDLVGKAAKCANCGTLFHAVVKDPAAHAPPQAGLRPSHVEPPPPPSRDDAGTFAGLLELDQAAAKPTAKGHATKSAKPSPAQPAAKFAPPPLPGLVTAQTLGLGPGESAPASSLLDEEFSRLEALASAPQAVLGSSISTPHRSRFKFLRHFKLTLRQDETILLYVAVIASLLGMAVSVTPALGLQRFSWGFSTVLSTVGFLMGLMGAGLAGYALRRNSHLRALVVGVLVAVLLSQFILVGQLRGPDPSEPLVASKAGGEETPKPVTTPTPTAGNQEGDGSSPPPLSVVASGDDGKPPTSPSPSPNKASSGASGMRISEEIANAPEVNPATEPPASGRPMTIWNAKRTPGQGQTYCSVEYRLKPGNLMADTPIQWVIEDDEGQTTFVYTWGRLAPQSTLQKALAESKLGDALRRRGTFKTWFERAQPRRELISNVLTFTQPPEEK